MTARRLTLRAPFLLDPEGSASTSVDIRGEWDPLVIRIGCVSRSISLPVDAGWALWRVLGEALWAAGEPPAWALERIQVREQEVWWRRVRRPRKLPVEALLAAEDVQMARAGRGAW